MEHLWKLANNFQELILSFFQVGSRDSTCSICVGNQLWLCILCFSLQGIQILLQPSLDFSATGLLEGTQNEVALLDNL